MNMVVQLELRNLVKMRQGMIAATGSITVPNERDGFYLGYKKLKLHFERGIYNQVELGSTYPLYKSTILGPLYVINQYQNLTVRRNPSYFQWSQFRQLDKWNWDTKICLSYKHGHITTT